MSTELFMILATAIGVGGSIFFLILGLISLNQFQQEINKKERDNDEEKETSRTEKTNIMPTN